MNLPNRITIARLILIPFTMIFMIFPILPDFWSRIIAAGIFGVTAFTDFLDGYIARKYNMITDFGKFLDPLVDKMLIFGAYIGILIMHSDNKIFCIVFAWVFFIVILREIAVTSLRMIVSTDASKVVAASWLGKIKTVSQMVCVIYILLEPLMPWGAVPIISYGLIIIMTFMTLWSGIDYFKIYLPLLDIKK
ncbi:MAG: CDP-diacylglycerol--glycerol-3-phosphate 3-phosphatidyltransferase [Oscillospiraceae bacterium]|nr:CDP-diacylglycerol--glycerol-3-phosphate 3-phosphatidyltransferase [Oscillospiraceae bacterium]